MNMLRLCTPRSANLGKSCLRFGSFVLVTILATASAFAGKKAHETSAVSQPPVSVAVQNSSFEEPAMTTGRWTYNEPVIGWTTLPGSQVGTWNPSAGFFAGAPWDGAQVMYINYGGVSQQLGVTLQPYTDYAVSLEWGVITASATPTFSVELLAANKSLGSCTPPFTPAPGKTATVTLIYHNGTTNKMSQPINIRILNSPPSTPYQLYPSMAAHIVDDVTFTVADRAGAAPRAKLECSYTFLQ